MESTTVEQEKVYDDACIKFMLDKQAKLSDPTSPVFYFNRTENAPFTVKQDDEGSERRLKRLEELGHVHVSNYIRPFDQQEVPGKFQVDILPSGMELVRQRVTDRTVTTTVTTSERIVEPLPAENLIEKRRIFSRTDRGNSILNAIPEALLSDLKSHIQAISTPGLAKSDFKVHTIWLRYCLLWRWSEIPEPLRQECQFYRDLAYTGNRRSK